MALLLPIACAVLAGLLWSRASPGPDMRARGRAALLGAAVSTGLFAAAVVELTSLLRVFDRAAILISWLAAAILLAVFALRRRSASPVRTVAFPWEPGRADLLIGLALLSVAVGLTAWAAAPNNWDSMTYHLPRVLHWIQNGSVAHYPTHVIRQLTLGPGAEFLAAQVHLLEGSERFLAFLQTLAWLGSAAAASLLAEDLGAGRAGQLFTAVFAATLPMALLQASSTQNDLVASFWLLVFVHFSLRFVRGQARFLDGVGLGGSLGLALLTKATAYLFAFPVVCGLAVAAAASRRAANRKGLLAAALLALLVNAGFWTRNLGLFGSPLGGEHGAVNESFSPPILLSNLARNTALQLTSPWRGWNRGVEEAVTWVHAGLRIPVDDPRSTWRGAEFHVPAGLRGTGSADSDEAFYAMLHEDQASNPLHLVFLLAAAVLVLARRRISFRRTAIAYLAGLAFAFLLFSLVLKWQPWGARLELPLFLLGAPLVGVAFAGRMGGRWSTAIAALLLVASLPWVLLNATRPLLGPDSVLVVPRYTQFFAARPRLAFPLTEAARFVAARACTRVGLEISPDDPEYLVWIALRAAGEANPRIEHVRVENRSAALASVPPFASFRPCAVIELQPQGAPSSGEELFSREWSGGRVVVRSGTP